jgi:stage IV sporulation protein B
MDYSSKQWGYYLQRNTGGQEPMKKRLFSAGWALILTLSLSVTAAAQQTLIPVGRVVGLALADGSVTVAAYDDIHGEGARSSGLKIGDDIVSVDGHRIDSASDLEQALRISDGDVELMIRRMGEEKSLRLCPAVTEQGPKLGVYIREGVTGIGTVTYYNPEEGTFGALGHGVSDCHGKLCPMNRGDVFDATVNGVKKGLPGDPGQLRGQVREDDPVGGLYENSPFGVFGSGISFRGEALPVAQADQVRTGSAQILSNIQEDQVEIFAVEILKITDKEHSDGRDLMIRVTDERLLETTGGIVAGMSGSPIIQDGKLVGAVTHVLVNDPTRGYGIFIENMLEAAA